MFERLIDVAPSERRNSGANRRNLLIRRVKRDSRGWGGAPPHTGAAKTSEIKWKVQHVDQFAENDISPESIIRMCCWLQLRRQTNQCPASNFRGGQLRSQ